MEGKKESNGGGKNKIRGYLYKRGNIWWMSYQDAFGKMRSESAKTHNKKEAIHLLSCRRKEVARSRKSVALTVAAGGQKAAPPKPSAPILGDPNPVARSHSKLGFFLMIKDQDDTAIREFKEAIRLKPNYAQAYYGLGLVYHKKGQYNKRQWTSSSEAGSDMGQYDIAIGLFKEAIRLKPDYAQAYYNLGLMYSEMGQYDLAKRLFEEAIRFKPNYAKAYYSLGQYEEAIRLKPDYAEAHHGLGRTYVSKGLYDLAIRQYQEAIRLKPYYVEAYYNLALTYHGKGQNDLAKRQFVQARQIKPYLEIHGVYEFLFMRRGIL